MKKRRMVMTGTILLVSLVTMPLWANNVAVDNVFLTEQNFTDHYTHIKFDISWDNSWRVSTGPSNWDAVWVFAKYRVGSGAWAHCTLDTVDANHTAPNGSTIDAPNEAKSGNAFAPGIFIYRSANGTGSVDWDNAKLRWNYGTDGIDDGAIVDVKVFAIEMVYIPEGSFALHTSDHASLYANFEKEDGSISSEDALSEGAITWDRSESNWCGAGTSDGSAGYNAALGVNYPKGYEAIYCMKYEISQGQYADFLNMLTDAQDDNRFPNANGSSRHTISGSYGSYSASRPNRACNYLNWADGLAYADWAGLRPMTELEFEKICRGSESAGTEYAWGNTTITYAAGISGTEDGTETITNEDANCCYYLNEDEKFFDGDGGYGPLRCGIFATASTNRTQSGASYYGVMEMSGNLWECCITVAKYCYNNSTWNNETGAGSFDGQHGDGVLDASGYANVSNWPSPTAASGWTAYGSSIRGGAWNSLPSQNCPSRVTFQLAAYPYAYRNYTNGFRCGRSAP